MSDTDRARCEACKLMFRFRDKEPPRHCGALACRARIEWTADQWNGRARTATARRLACLPLDELDQEALEREEF